VNFHFWCNFHSCVRAGPVHIFFQCCLQTSPRCGRVTRHYRRMERNNESGTYAASASYCTISSISSLLTSLSMDGVLVNMSVRFSSVTCLSVLRATPPICFHRHQCNK
jgi:hypothetical protein